MSTTAVILAAGLSTRMGGPNKLLLDLAGRPVVRRVAEAVLSVTDIAPVVVLGRDAALVEAVLLDLPLRFVRNPDPAAGQARSVRLGLAAARDAEETLIALGDQPLVTGAALGALLAAHRQGGGDRVTVPVRAGVRGNPIVLPRAIRADIALGGPNLACRAFTETHPHLVRRFETADPAFFLDIDTPEDYARARADLEEAVR